MTDLPLVTIMIPTYNQELYIERTVKSALNQDYPNLEIIISNDLSTDNTENVILSLIQQHQRLRYYKSPSNLGRVKNYRKLLYEYSTGEYVVNLDGDDVFVDASFISKGINSLQSIPVDDRPLMYVACKRLVSYNGFVNNIHKIPENKKIVKGEEFIYNLYSKYFFSHLTTLYVRSEALETNFYTLDVLSTDSDSLLRLAIKGNVYLSQDIVGEWNETDTNESKLPDFRKQLNNLNWIHSVNKTLMGNMNFFRRLKWKYSCLYLYSNGVIDTLLLHNNRNSKNVFYFIFSQYSMSLIVLYGLRKFKKVFRTKSSKKL